METITVRTSGKPSTSLKCIYSNYDWFRECLYYSFVLKPDMLIITKQRLDISKSAHKCVHRKDGKGNQFEFDIDLDYGVYEIETKLSNEDQLIILL